MSTGGIAHAALLQEHVTKEDLVQVQIQLTNGLNNVAARLDALAATPPLPRSESSRSASLSFIERRGSQTLLNKRVAAPTTADDELVPLRIGDHIYLRDSRRRKPVRTVW
eukprot:CAMPEP_0119481624 /NCGR_PEP_ID=MMETSP1344-20130328/9873_1 /TAXON_ID=236787 /ORGANISM="Florenciella parvula, Strain CCMP2471" /LENGTH=109 /DNA_ID=CAMNT_0007516001 /DNA_START=287 /DNA_END=613 /DNA_ORIENTATION=+